MPERLGLGRGPAVAAPLAFLVGASFFVHTALRRTRLCLSLLISRIGGLSSSLSTHRVLTAASRDQLLSDGLGDRVSAIANTELGLHFL